MMPRHTRKLTPRMPDRIDIIPNLITDDMNYANGFASLLMTNDMPLKDILSLSCIRHLSGLRPLSFKHKSRPSFPVPLTRNTGRHWNVTHLIQRLLFFISKEHYQTRSNHALTDLIRNCHQVKLIKNYVNFHTKTVHFRYLYIRLHTWSLGRPFLKINGKRLKKQAYPCFVTYALMSKRGSSRITTRLEQPVRMGCEIGLQLTRDVCHLWVIGNE